MSEALEAKRARLLESRQHAQADIAEVGKQVEAGELDRATAERLEQAYQSEIEAANEALVVLESSRDPAQGRSIRRTVSGVIIFIIAVVGITALAAVSIVPREGGPITGDVVTDPVDLASVSNESMESVIAASGDHPEINGMRLALADRYFVAGDFRSALPHYQAVLTNEPEPLEAGVSLGRIGWMFYQSGGEPEVAAEYLRQSLAVTPTYDEAKLYLSMVLLYGLEDAEAATPLLQELAQRNDLPADLLVLVTEALDLATGGP